MRISTQKNEEPEKLSLKTKLKHMLNTMSINEGKD